MPFSHDKITKRPKRRPTKMGEGSAKKTRKELIPLKKYFTSNYILTSQKGSLLNELHGP
jgi:hypothetical protein